MQKNRFVLVLVLAALVLCGCDDSTCAAVVQFAATASNLAAGAVNATIGAPLLPTNASGAGLCGNAQNPPKTASALGPDGTPTACAPADDDDACTACAKASCCTTSLSCFASVSCNCNVACNTLGSETCPASLRESCGAEDDTYDAEVSCLVEHCHEECPGQ
jgi:hypothetical protein